MLRTKTQESLDILDLDAMQIGWEFDATQLDRADRASSVKLIQSERVSLVPITLNASFDQTLRGRPGYVNFGMPELNSTPIWVGGEPVEPGKLVLFPTGEEGSSASRSGFHATAIHLQQAQVEQLLQVLFHQTLGDLLAHTGTTQMSSWDYANLSFEVRKWNYLAGHTHLATAECLRRREDDLSQKILSCLLRGEVDVASRRLKSERALSTALEFIHDGYPGDATVTSVCNVAGCSISTLEYSFSKRFGTTPKQYMKGLQLSRVRNDLKNFDRLGYETITDAATRHGFWHMGQFAADYRKLFRELPSQTVARCCTPAR